MENPAIRMNAAIIGAYYQHLNASAPVGLIEKINELLLSDDPFKKKVDILDSILEEHKIPEDIGELMFDVVLYNFFSEDSQRLGESFFESKEWEKMEDSIIERGTELLNILLYLQECKDSAIHYSIDDYLDEYLMTEEDMDQEEHEVYEAVIKNRETIAEGDLNTMVEISNSNPDSALGDQLLPFLLYFEMQSGINKKFELIEKNGSNPGFQGAFLAALNVF